MWKSRKATASTIDRRKNAHGRVNRCFCRTQVKQPPHAALPHCRFDTLRGTKAKPLVFTADGFAVVIAPDDAATRRWCSLKADQPTTRKPSILRCCRFQVRRFRVPLWKTQRT